jgi:predicted lipoprotein with Yx(FWY)xxD motif
LRLANFVLCLLAALAIAASGCGGGDSTGAKPAAETESVSSAVAVISADQVSDLGTILVDGEGRTLYDFHKDRHTDYIATSSACYGACAEEWPPLLTGGEPEAEGGAIATKLGVLKRKDGTLQVTYYGHPLYTYEGDKEPGIAAGNSLTAFGGKWHALQPNNEEPGS